MSAKRLTALLATAALAATIAAAGAQPGPGGGPRGPGMGMGPGMMMGPGMGRGMSSRMCSPGAAGFAEWRTERLERVLRLTDAQKPKFDEFKAASAKAAEAMRAACTTDIPVSMTARMAAMEKRMEATLAAVKTVRPALDAFYATLTDEQKARIESDRGPRRYWRWRDRW
ncbi:MAG: hypothetical protein FJX62_19810 [Alphaproteobacteria bacterium]|nr:hypothetical protein [Alphaproteobacteria bacterium]